MKFEEYIKKAERTCSKLETKELDNLHQVLGMVTEVGELADVFKKNMAYGKEIDWVNVNEELFDILWYIANFCRINNIDFEKGLETNIEKLEARYPEKFFTEERADKRDLKKERAVLENRIITKEEMDERFRT